MNIFKRRRKNYKRSIAKEFTKKRQRKIRYIFSKANFKISRFITKIAAISFAILLVIISIGFVFSSKYLSIRHIELIRSDFITNTEKIYLSVKHIRDKSIIFINKKALAEKIKEEHPYISLVEIDRIFPDTIRLKLSTYPILAKMQIHIASSEETQTVFVNQIGMVSHGTREDEDLFLIEQKEEYLDFAQNGQKLIESDILQNILDNKSLLENTLSMAIKKVEYFKNAQELHYITGSDIAFWIDFASPAEKQIKKLEHIMAETDILSKNLEYVDLRVDGRIYWKEKDE
jgi:cell division septal protein FtsQ